MKGWSENWIDLQGFLKLDERLRIAMRVHQGSGIVHLHDRRKRIERQREPEFLERLIESFFGNEKGKSVEIMHSGAIGNNSIARLNSRSASSHFQLKVSH